MAKRLTNLGEAAMIVELKGGFITARHIDGALLLSAKADGNSWDKIIAGIVQSCKRPIGPMVA